MTFKNPFVIDDVFDEKNQNRCDGDGDEIGFMEEASEQEDKKVID